jgi:hypothetical protein
MRASSLVALGLAAGALAHASAASADGGPSDTGPAAGAVDAEPRWGVRLWSSERWLGDASMAALTTDTLGGGGVAVERRLLALPVPGPFDDLAVSAELSFDAGSVDGTTFQQLDNHVSTWAISAGARARLPVLSWLQVQGRAALGAGRTTVRIADQMTGGAIEDRAATAVASSGVGLAVMPTLRRGSRFRFVLDAELGYQTTTSTGVRAYPEDRPAPELTIPASYATLGDVDLDGWTLRFGAGVAF